MNGTRKTILMIVGALAAVLIVAQLVMGLLILNGRDLRTAHQHSGYVTVVVSLIYILGSLMVLASVPSRTKP